MLIKKYVLASSLLILSGYTLAFADPEIRENNLNSRTSASSLGSYTDKILSDEFTLNAADRKTTRLALANDSAYTARYRVEYCADDGTGNHLKYVEQSSSLIATERAYFTLPADAYYTKVTAEYATGLLWAPWKNIYQHNLCANLNEWSISYPETGTMNTIKINNWGTLFNIGWGTALPESSNTPLIKNKNANPLLGCNF